MLFPVASVSQCAGALINLFFRHGEQALRQ
jgi:hypothetical protein